MAKQQNPPLKSDTTKVDPRYIITKEEELAMKNRNAYDNTNDVTKKKNIANIEAMKSLIQRNAERVKEGKKPLPKPVPTLTDEDLKKNELKTKRAITLGSIKMMAQGRNKK